MLDDPPYFSTTRKFITLALGTVVAVALLSHNFAHIMPVGMITTGMDYMGTFFHELGHSVFAWMFGYPSLPSFDFQHGGGMAYHFGRVVYLQWGMIAAGAFGLWAVWRYSIFWAVVAGTLYVGLVIASLTSFHDVIILFMGHGAESAMGAFILARVMLDAVPNRPGEFEMHAFAGPYLIMGPIVDPSWGLITDPIYRDDYWAQKGGEGFGDFSRIADYFGWASEIPVAWACILFSVTITVVPVVAAYICRRYGY
jgi:hypothetical protein